MRSVLSTLKDDGQNEVVSELVSVTSGRSAQLQALYESWGATALSKLTRWALSLLPSFAEFENRDGQQVTAPAATR